MPKIVSLYNIKKRRNSTLRVLDSYPHIATQFVYKIPTTAARDIRASLDYHNPVIEVNRNTPSLIDHDLTKYFYANIEGDFFYINMMRWITSDIIELTLELDVLATYEPEIRATTAYIEYATNYYNPYLRDFRTQTLSTVQKITSAGFSGDSLPFSTQGCYILGTIGDVAYSSAGGFVTTYAISETNLFQVVKNLMENQSFWDEISQFFADVKNAVAFCRWIPFDLITVRDETNNQTDNVALGNYPTDIEALILQDKPIIQKILYFTIPWRYNDFRDSLPYTTMSLDLPFIGDVEVNVTDFIGQDLLMLKQIVSLIDGSLIYKVSTVSTETTVGVDVATFECNCSTTIPIAAQSMDWKGTITNTISASASLIGALVPGIHTGISVMNGLNSIANAVVSANTRNNSLKSLDSGGFAKASATFGLMPQLNIFSSDTFVPTLLANLQGNPCNQVMNIESLGYGYIKCRGASVSINGYESERQEINTFLNEVGIYVEEELS